MTNKYTAVPMPMAFWSQVDTSSGPNECWSWRGRLNGSGYGSWSRGDYERAAHRAAYALVIGPIPDGAYVLHRCDNRRCCNPVHLFLGTHQTNMDDMIAKGRAASGNAKRHLGMAHGRAKLTDDDVRDIRASTESCRSLAARYGVSFGLVGHIKRGRIWKHL